MRSLSLAETRIHEGRLDSLQPLKLEWLSLKRTRADDQGLESLQGMTSLRYLDLTRTKVTDAGLKYLRTLPNLKKVVLRRTLVTKEGADRLRRELSGAEVQWEPLRR